MLFLNNASSALGAGGTCRLRLLKCVFAGGEVFASVKLTVLAVSYYNVSTKSEGKKEWNVVTNEWGKTDYNCLNRYLTSCNVPIQYVGNGYGQFSDNTNKITLMTYHSAKGLDFDNVFLPFLNNSLFIVPNETLSKTLFMVAMTRSRNNLYLTYSGYKHSYLDNFASDCNKIDVHDALNSQSQTYSGSNNVFAGF